MSQDVFDSIDPAISGTELATILNDFKDALMSGLSGTSRPTELAAGGMWVDTTNDPTTWTLKLWTGTDDVAIFVIDLSSGGASVSLAVDSFSVRRVSADTTGAILELVKRRIASSGQVLSGDVVGEVRMVGRDDAASNPVVAKIMYTATENQTAAAFGGTLSFYSTPVGTATLIEHMKFIGGVIETIVPHKVNSQVLVSQNVATTATIAQLSAAKTVVEMTGSTATDIQGINAAHDSKTVTIHNRSSAVVTLKHQNLSAAAADRMILPGATDVLLQPEESATLIYSTADTKWRAQFTSAKFGGFTQTNIYATKDFVAPSSVSVVRLAVTRRSYNFGTRASRANNKFGESFAWGSNTNGELGVGDVTPRSSPVAVLGSLRFKTIYSASLHTYGITPEGVLYAWGQNTFGQLGVGDVTSRSSPVAVLGSLRWSKIVVPTATSFGNYAFGLTEDGRIFAWGRNSAAYLGVGDKVDRSSPVAVLGSRRYRDIYGYGNATSGTRGASFGIDETGDLYAWGENDSGELGLGDVVQRSSPVAVLGSLKVAKVVGTQDVNLRATLALTEAGAAYGWGMNTVGVLGLGDSTNRSSPVAVLGGHTFIDIVAGGVSAYGLKADGSLYAWGANTNGQLGVGDVTARSSPVAVLGGFTFRKVFCPAGAGNYVFGITTDNVLYAWGVNASGQLGVGDVNPRSSPVAVLGGLKVFDISGQALGISMVAITTEGLLYAWGSNTSGDLGLGDVTARSSPVAVLGSIFADYGVDTSYFDIPVTGGNTYRVVVAPGRSYFGTTYIGDGVTKVEVEYPS